MASKLKSETARRNGAKSRGPVTPAGKSNSAGNNRTHAMLFKTIVIAGENAARFAALLDALRTHLQPRNTIEEGLVEDLATCRWRQRRLLSMETATLTNEIHRQNPESAAESNATRAAIALGDSAANSRTLELIHRYEVRFGHQYDRTLRRYLKIRALPSQINNQVAQEC